MRKRVHRRVLVGLDKAQSLRIDKLVLKAEQSIPSVKKSDLLRCLIREGLNNLESLLHMNEGDK